MTSFIWYSGLAVTSNVGNLFSFSWCSWLSFHWKLLWLPLLQTENAEFFLKSAIRRCQCQVKCLWKIDRWYKICWSGFFFMCVCLQMYDILGLSSNISVAKWSPFSAFSCQLSTNETKRKNLCHGTLLLLYFHQIAPHSTAGCDIV